MSRPAYDRAVAVSPVIALEGAPRDYAWGSATVIQGLLGRAADGAPLGELWFGAHPDDPAHCPEHASKLDALIARDPAGMLGDDAVARFGPQLPFLVKILAAEAPLSIQVHPTRAQAAAGFDDEDARGVPRGAPFRNYHDRNHKPELLCALTEFDALCGFRPVPDTLRLLHALGAPGLEGLAATLATDGLRAAFTQLLTLDEPAPLVAAVVAAAPRLSGEWATARRAIELGALHFPQDVGVVLSLLLNAVRLQPGEATFLPAGNVHAYLHGAGVEVMANSDNVLRCAFTPKHVDVAELLRVADFTALPEPRAGGDGTYRGLVPDFDVVRVDLAGASRAVGAAGPVVVVCTRGTTVVTSGSATVELGPARGAFVRAGDATGLVLRGSGQCFVASVGSAPAN